jgi:hypothetical protein
MQPCPVLARARTPIDGGSRPPRHQKRNTLRPHLAKKRCAQLEIFEIFAKIRHFCAPFDFPNEFVRLPDFRRPAVRTAQDLCNL